MANDYRFRVEFPAEIGRRFQSHLDRTGLTAKDLLISAYVEYADALERGWANSAQPVGDSRPGVMQIAQPEPQVPQNQPYTLPPRTPHRGMLPTDTDEILVLLEELNAMPDATELDLEHGVMNGVRKIDIQRDIRRLRAAVTEKRAQVVQNQ